MEQIKHVIRTLPTDTEIYGEVACQRQGEIIRELAMPQKNMQTDANEIAEAVFNRLSKDGMDSL